MKRALYAICSQFGTVMDIVVMKTFRLRGQAWVVFEDLAMAANAMRSLNGFDLFDKEMVRARNRSSAQGGRRPRPRGDQRASVTASRSSEGPRKRRRPASRFVTGSVCAPHAQRR